MAKSHEFVEDELGLCRDQPIPVSLVEENFATTDVSAVVRIDSVGIVWIGDAPPTKTGYVKHRYHTTVLEMMSGLPLRELVFDELADADVQPRRIGTALIVSLCRMADPALPENHFYSPDNGYVFCAPRACIEKARALKKQPRVDDASACSR